MPELEENVTSPVDGDDSDDDMPGLEEGDDADDTLSPDSKQSRSEKKARKVSPSSSHSATLPPIYRCASGVFLFSRSLDTQLATQPCAMCVCVWGWVWVIALL
jgi:hypothetical protein